MHVACPTGLRPIVGLATPFIMESKGRRLRSATGRQCMSDSSVCCRAVELPVLALSRIRMNPNESQRSRGFRFCMLRAMSVHCAGRFPPSANRPFPLQSLPRITRSLTLALVLAVACLSGCGAQRESEPANLLLVTLDTVRADSLGSYGGEAAISPNLDRLAAQSVRFETAISSAAVTPVAHASILTGLYPYGHGLRVLSADGGFRLEPEIPSLAGVLQDAGYRTGAVHSSFTVSGYFGFERGFDVFESFETSLKKKGEFRDWGLHENQRRADATTDIAIRFLEGEPNPFFLWVHYWDMHDPVLLPDPDFMPPEEQLERSPRGVIQPNAALYAAEIRYMDHHFGRLLDALEARGLASNTIIAVVADHGEGLGDHGWRFHRLLYQEQVRVPLLLRIPGVASGTSVDALVRSVDLLPTLLDYLALEIPAGLHGRSLRALVEGGEEEPRVAYADQINLFDKNAMMIKRRPHDVLLYSVQDLDWKLIYKPMHPGKSELYHLSKDPSESRNLFRNDHPAARRLLEDLAEREAWVKEPPSGAGMDAEARRRLEALGYVEADEESGGLAIEWQYSPAAQFGERLFASAVECQKASGSPCVLIHGADSPPVNP
jgi:arylsulfatase A-like enzyme